MAHHEKVIEKPDLMQKICHLTVSRKLGRLKRGIYRVPKKNVFSYRDIDIVRITSGFESLKSMMESASDIATNPDYSKFRTQVSNLTQNVMSWNYRVVHINQV